MIYWRNGGVSQCRTRRPCCLARRPCQVRPGKAAEVVFVWTDRFAQDGVGHMLVKGQAIARQAFADNKMAVSTRVAAIPCNRAEQAQALLHELGERESVLLQRRNNSVLPADT